MMELRLLEANIVAPMEKLIGRHGSRFIGREAELRRLADYVAAQERHAKPCSSLAARPPLMIQGPGGVGKSSLLAKFVIDHAFGQGPRLPFVYLDFDRPGLDPARPLSLLIEAARQLGEQLPEVKPRLDACSDTLSIALRACDAFQEPPDEIIRRFGDVLCALPPVGKTPVLFVLDTFEEVQFRGEELVHLVWNLLEKLQAAAPRLRIVLCGRADLPTVPNTPLNLSELDFATACAFVSFQLEQLGKEVPDSETLVTLVDIVGKNPLSLKLAGLLLAEEGIAALDNVETRRQFFLKVKAERIQAMLHGRILSHLRRRTGEHGEKLYRLAHPGLAVRRMTSDVIEKVLAGPCDVALSGAAEARTLFDLFRAEVALLEADPSDPEDALRQRSDVRRIMLADLDASETVKAKAIDRNAVRYYAGRRHEGPIMRAEEIYHRLRLGEDEAVLDPLWTDDLRPSLRGAVDEVGPQARLWLSARLGITPDKSLLADADQESWETHAERRVRAYLSESPAAPEQALKVLQERDSRRLASPLYLLEAETLRMLARPQAAIAVAMIGLNALAEAQEPALARAAGLERLISLVEESIGGLAAALDAARRAERLARDSGDRLGLLQAQVAQLRLLRKLGRQAGNAATYESLLGEVDGSLTPAFHSALRQRPALLRELVAELGSINPAVLDLGVETLGLELAGDQQQREFAEILKQWDRETDGGIAERFGIGTSRRPGSGATWLDFITSNNGSPLDQAIRRMLLEHRPNAVIAESLTRIFRASVDNTIRRTARHNRPPR
ncbi:MAG: ATP-binding protein [Parvibaculaceae bacterium]